MAETVAIKWTHRDLAEAIHERLIAEHGGNPGIRDENLLELALVRPQQLFAYRQPQPDLAELAATLAFGLARNHPFVDANKRTALVCYRTFLALNDLELVASGEEKFRTLIALAEGQLSEKKFADWLRARTRPVTRRTPRAKKAAKKKAKKKAKKR
ncbi:MAG TPA: type II toxin-antitoxin system death-on-curing family toxin [Nevskiaceae bacterium]|nr:type II toxin-antitoxin system death-on-curing family toxin [Nevskiaceae bacterium]